jgi:hypothetical protein
LFLSFRKNAKKNKWGKTIWFLIVLKLDSQIHSHEKHWKYHILDNQQSTNKKGMSDN